MAARTVTDALVLDKVRELAWTVDHDGVRQLAPEGVRQLAPEGLYGQRNMTRLVRRSMSDASPGSVDRAMQSLGLQGIRRAKASGPRFQKIVAWHAATAKDTDRVMIPLRMAL